MESGNRFGVCGILQPAEIVGPSSSERRGGRFGSPARPSTQEDTSQPATIVGVGGADGRFGRRLFLRLQIGDRVLRLYGGTKALAAALSMAGYPDAAGDVVEGRRFDFPCRVVTAQSGEGGFVNVVQVLPAARHSAS